jgi:putative DNA-invertase from lambdoid prophage Rac
MRVAIYARVSTHDQNCERQIKDLTEYAKLSGFDVVGIWSEFGSGVKLDRAKRKEVMLLARARKIDAVLVTELTRWGRIGLWTFLYLLQLKFTQSLTIGE